MQDIVKTAERILLVDPWSHSQGGPDYCQIFKDWYQDLAKSDQDRIGDWLRNEIKGERNPFDRGVLAAAYHQTAPDGSFPYIKKVFIETPFDSDFRLQEATARILCNRYDSKIETLLLERVQSWFDHLERTGSIAILEEKANFGLAPEVELLRTLVGLIARNSFEQGLRLLPRCVGRACDLDLLRNLTEFPKQELTDDELREVKEAIESLGSEYVDSLKFRIMEFAPTNLGHPLRDLVLSIVNYPLARADSDSLSLLSKHLSKSGLAPDRLEITDEGQYAYILSSSVESLADQMEKEAFPFEIGLQFLAYRIMDPYSKDLIEDVPGIHILRIGLFEDSEPREFFLLFNLDQEGLEELRTISKRDD